MIVYHFNVIFLIYILKFQDCSFFSLLKSTKTSTNATQTFCNVHNRGRMWTEKTNNFICYISLKLDPGAGALLSSLLYKQWRCDTNMRTLCTFILQHHVSQRHSLKNAILHVSYPQGMTLGPCSVHGVIDCVTLKPRSGFDCRLHNRKWTVKKIRQQ